MTARRPYPRSLLCALAVAVGSPSIAVATEPPQAGSLSSPSSSSSSSRAATEVGGRRRLAELNPEQRSMLRDRIKQKIQTYLTVELSSRAGLDDKKSLQLGALVKTHLEKRADARKSRHEAFLALRTLVDQKAGDAALKAQMKAALATHDKEQAMDELINELGTFLTPTEQAKVLLAFPEVMKDAKRLIRQARGGDDGDDGGPRRRGGRGKRGGLGGPGADRAGVGERDDDHDADDDEP